MNFSRYPEKPPLSPLYNKARRDPTAPLVAPETKREIVEGGKRNGGDKIVCTWVQLVCTRPGRAHWVLV